MSVNEIRANNVSALIVWLHAPWVWIMSAISADVSQFWLHHPAARQSNYTHLMEVLSAETKRF